MVVNSDLCEESDKFACSTPENDQSPNTRALLTHSAHSAHSANSRRSMESMQEWSSGGGFKKAQPLSMDDTDCRFNMNKQLFEAENEEVAGLSSTTPRKFAAYLQEVEQTSAAQAQAIEDVRKLTAIVSSAQVFTKKFRAKPSEVVVEAVPETAVEAAAPSVAVVGSKPLSMRLFLSIALLLVVFVGLFFGTTHTIPAVPLLAQGRLPQLPVPVKHATQPPVLLRAPQLSAMGTADTVVPSTLVTQAPVSQLRTLVSARGAIKMINAAVGRIKSFLSAALAAVVRHPWLSFWKH